MTLEELIAEAKTLADDGANGELWKREEWIRWANEAQREACRRARLLVDSTSGMTQIVLPAGVALTKLDPRILFLRRVRLAARPVFLVRISHQDLDCRAPSWEDETGEPRAYVPDMDTSALRPWPIPTEDTAIRLTVVRMPLKDMKVDSDAPEIAARFHPALVSWMLYRAHSKQDAETVNLKKAAEYLLEFEGEFGKKSSAIDETWLQQQHDYLPAEGNF